VQVSTACVDVFRMRRLFLVPRSSSTSVAAWAWPTWVVSRRRLLEYVFILLESPSRSRRIFIGSHSHPPSLVRRIGPSIGIRSGYRSSFTLTSLRSRDGVPGIGFGSSTLRWQKLPDVEYANGGVPPADQLSCSKIEGHVRCQQQGGRLLVSCFVST
jgi:hypothetical protein